MKTNPLLSADTTRCLGIGCDYKTKCLRYLARKDDIFMMSLVDTMGSGTFCDHAITANPDEIEMARERGAL